MLHSLDEAIIEVQEFGKEISGTLAIGSTIYCAPVMLSTLNDFRQQYSLVKFNIWEGSSTHLMELLENRQIDIAITGGPFSKDNIEMQNLHFFKGL